MSVHSRVEAIEEECDGVWSEYGITSWERAFISDIKDLGKLSPRQEETLRQIENKAGIDDED